MPVFLNQRTVGQITILELSEHLKAENVSEFRDTIQHLVEQGQRYLLLDCSRLRIVDSQGIGSLVGNWVSLKKRGGNLGLLNPPFRLRDVLRIVGLQEVIDIGEALSSLAVRSTTSGILPIDRSENTHGKSTQLLGPRKTGNAKDG